MAHCYYHALSSVRKWGGTVDDYLPLHQWFDQSKAILPDPRHRALRHHAEGIFMLEAIFGETLVNADGRVVPVRLVGERILELWEGTADFDASRSRRGGGAGLDASSADSAEYGGVDSGWSGDSVAENWISGYDCGRALSSVVSGASPFRHGARRSGAGRAAARLFCDP